MERKLATALSGAALLLLVFGTSACSISNSSETLSNSISSPFEWSSDSSDSSSDSSAGDSAYRQDVSDYTVAFATGDGDLDAFRSGLRLLSERRGVTNWEEDGLTLASIGQGLNEAGWKPDAMRAFAQELLGANAPGLEALQAGYASIP